MWNEKLTVPIPVLYLCSPSYPDKPTDLKSVSWQPHTYWHCVLLKFAVCKETCTQNGAVPHARANCQYQSMPPPICMASCGLCQCSSSGGVMCAVVMLSCACLCWGGRELSEGLLCPSGYMNVGQCLCSTVKGRSSLPLHL